MTTLRTLRLEVPEGTPRDVLSWTWQVRQVLLSRILVNMGRIDAALRAGPSITVLLVIATARLLFIFIFTPVSSLGGKLMTILLSLLLALRYPIT